jgi:DNA repair exonuclease SbcCD nuclease subunit
MKPKAVLISDIHYNLNTLELADAALRQAFDKANQLKVKLIIAGDLHDSKANLRAECMNAMLRTFKDYSEVEVWILRGNHDSINEKSKEHSLNFLAPYANIIEEPMYMFNIGYLVPYYHNPEELKSYLKTLPKGATLVMHQGITGSNSGEYIQDKSAITPNDVAGFRVISGHYHTRQTIKLPKGGSWDYIGNPFTLNFGEAGDPEKGFQILMDDGSLEFVPTNLRRHIVLNVSKVTDYWQITGKVPLEDVRSIDIVKVKLTATKEELSSMTRERVAKMLNLSNFKLDLIPLETTTTAPAEAPDLTQEQLLDSLIDSVANTSKEQKERLKELWRGL